MPTAFAQTPEISPPPTAAAIQDAAGLLPPSVTAWVLIGVAAAALAWWLGPSHPYQPRDTAAAFDLERDLPTAKAVVQHRDANKPCVWRAGDRRFACAEEPWAFVGPYAGTTAGVARRCTWAHPVAAGSTIELSWDNLLIGRELDASLGLVDGATGGAPLRLKIWLGQELLAELVTRDASDLAQTLKVIPAGPDRAALRLQVIATDHVLRMACLDVRMRGTRAAQIVHAGAR